MHCAQVSAGARAARRAQLVQDLLHLPPTAFPAIIARATVSESGTGSGSSSAGSERHHHRHPNFYSTSPTSNRSVTSGGAPADAEHSWPETLINQMGDTYHDGNDVEHEEDHHDRGASLFPADSAEQGSLSRAEGVSSEQESEQHQQCWRKEEGVVHTLDVPPSRSQSLALGRISHFSLRTPSLLKLQEHHRRQQQQQGINPSDQNLSASLEEQQQQQEGGGALEDGEERDSLFSSMSGPTMSSSYATPATSPAVTPTLTPSPSLTCPAFRRLASGSDRREGGIMDSASSISHMSACRSPHIEMCGGGAPLASVFGDVAGMMEFGESDPWAGMGLQAITQVPGPAAVPESYTGGGGCAVGGVGSLHRVTGEGSPRSASFGSRFADAVMRRGLARGKRTGRGWVAGIKHSLWGGGLHPQQS